MMHRSQLGSRALLSLAVALAPLVGIPGCSDDPAPAPADVELADAAIEQDTELDASAADAVTVLPAPATPSVTLTSGEATLEVNLDRADLVLRRGSAWLTRIELAQLRIGRVDRFDDAVSYNPGDYKVDADPEVAELPEGLSWLRIKKAVFVDHEPAPLAQLKGAAWALLDGAAVHCTTAPGLTLKLMTVDIAGKPGPDWTLIVRPVQACGPEQTQATFAADLRPMASGVTDDPKTDDDRIDAPVWVDVAITTGRLERFFGLGEYFDSAEHRGHVRPMQIQADLGVESGYNEAHVPVPLVIGDGGWGAFFQSRMPAVFDCGVEDPDRVHARFHASSMRLFLFAPATSLDIVGAYTKVTGAPVLPARWAFGGMIWRNENSSDAEVIDDMQMVRKHDLAISAMWLDRPYDTHVNNFDFDPQRIKDSAAMIDKVHALGMRVGLWSTPYVEEGGTYRKEFVANGWMVKVPPLAKQFLKWGGPVDLSNDDAKHRWQQLIDKMRKRGIEGWKLDFGEDVHVSLFTVRANYSFANQADERTMHHGVALYYHRPYFETLPGATSLGDVAKQLADPDAGGFILARAGTYGGQAQTSIIWPGDLDATLGEHGACYGGTCHVAGLPGAIAAMQSLAMSGYPLFGSDTGGYRHQRATKEVFMRWLAHTALSPILQLGGSKQHNPWDFAKHGDSVFDQEVLDAARYWTRLHMRLFAYLYTYAVGAARHQRGLVRPFAVMHPKLRAHGPVASEFAAGAASQYWLGDALLVAPITTSDGRRAVVLPAEHLYDWWTHKKVSAVTLAGSATPTVVQAQLGLDRIPLYLRGGAILPLLRPSVDTLAPAKDKSVDSFAADKGRLYTIVAPGEASKRALYDGTELAFDRVGKAIHLGVVAGNEFTQGVQWEIWTTSTVKAVAVADQPLSEQASAAAAGDCSACWWRDDGASVHVRMPPGSSTAVVLFSNTPQ